VNAFVSHNKADEESARLLAIALVERGVSVWFDEWEIQPGDSIAGGIETGLATANAFVLLWSVNAAKSKWVGTELRAFLHRRVADDGLKIIPIMMDGTSLPVLVADYHGFCVEEDKSFDQIADQISGAPPDKELIRRLQNRLLDLVCDHAGINDPLPFFVCPKCGSSKLKRFTQSNIHGTYYIVRCEECKWSMDTEV
jgi:predicted RNA-binding Zn-ribbon protein involved in translation (DUF1610 family)